MTAIDLLGLVAATLSTGSFVPQVVRLWRTRNAEGISLLTFAALAGGVSLWLAYGIMLGALPIIVANAITLVLVLAVVVLTVRFRSRPPTGK